MPIPVFNTPVESALRSIVLLVEFYPDPIDLQSLIYFDYLLVHTGDFNGPKSLHPATPQRTGELVVRREVIENGLDLLLSRGLADRIFSNKGICYQASELAGQLIASLLTAYSLRLRSYARWVRENHGNKDLFQLEFLFSSNIDRWSHEFLYPLSEPEEELI